MAIKVAWMLNAELSSSHFLCAYISFEATTRKLFPQLRILDSFGSQSIVSRHLVAIDNQITAYVLYKQATGQ